jgi:hypothetical protein
MAADLAVQIISVVVVIGMFALMVISKKLHYIVGGLVLIGVGIITLLFEMGRIDIDLGEFPIVNFAVYFMIVFAGKDLLKEGFKEKDSPLKWPSIILAIVLIVITTLPTLKKMKVIDWALPEYPPLIDAIIYMVSGVFLLIGLFTILATADD